MKYVFFALFIAGCLAFIIYNVVCIVKTVKERKKADKKANEKQHETIGKDEKSK